MELHDAVVLSTTTRFACRIVRFACRIVWFDVVQRLVLVRSLLKQMELISLNFVFLARGGKTKSLTMSQHHKIS